MLAGESRKKRASDVEVAIPRCVVKAANLFLVATSCSQRTPVEGSFQQGDYWSESEYRTAEAGEDDVVLSLLGRC